MPGLCLMPLCSDILHHLHPETGWATDHQLKVWAKIHFFKTASLQHLLKQ